MNLLLTIFLICTEAFYEGLKTHGRHILSASIEFIYLSVITIICFAWLNGINSPFEIDYIPFWKVLAGYLLVRLAVFDIIWNLSAGQKWNYYGTTKLYDKIMTELGGWGWMVKTIGGIIGMCFLIGWE